MIFPFSMNLFGMSINTFFHWTTCLIMSWLIGGGGANLIRLICWFFLVKTRRCQTMSNVDRRIMIKIKKIKGKTVLMCILWLISDVSFCIVDQFISLTYIHAMWKKSNVTYSKCSKCSFLVNTMLSKWTLCFRMVQTRLILMCTTQHLVQITKRTF